MEKDLEYFEVMFANRTALSMENVEDIQEAGHWLIKQIKKLEEDKKYWIYKYRICTGR